MIKEEQNNKSNKVFNLPQMETLVQQDKFLGNEYKKMSAGKEDKDGDFMTPEDRYGYHWNETILIILYNKHVINDAKLLSKYKSMKNKAKKRTKRGMLKLDEENVEIQETTTSASSGQFSSPFAFSSKGDFSKDMRKQKKGMTKAPIITRQTMIPNLMSSELNEWLNPSKHIDYFNQLKEEKEIPSIAFINKIKTQNGKNTKSDLSKGNLDNTKPEGGSFVELFKNTYSKDSLPKKDLKKFSFSSEEEKEMWMNRGRGLQDVKFNRKPTAEFEAKMKSEMGDEFYELRNQKVKYDEPYKNVMYKTQPVNVKVVKEDKEVMGRYKNRLKITEFVSFLPFGTKCIVENKNGYPEVFLDCLNEGLDSKLNNYSFFINEKTNEVFRIKKTKDVEVKKELFSESHSKISHLMNYQFEKTKKTVIKD